MACDGKLLLLGENRLRLDVVDCVLRPVERKRGTCAACSRSWPRPNCRASKPLGLELLAIHHEPPHRVLPPEGGTTEFERRL